jgi:hypothetical protein
MEEAFFADDSKFAELEVAEDELIDAYVREDLSSEEQRQFVSKLRNSRRLIERVHFARALAERAPHSVAPQHEGSIQTDSSIRQHAPKTEVRWWEGVFGQQPALRVAFAACVVVILVGGLILVTGWLRLRSESERINSERAALRQQVEALDQQLSDQQARTDQLTANLQRERDQRAEDKKLIEKLLRGLGRETRVQSILAAAASILLRPGSLRSAGDRPELALGPNTSTAQLKLALENNNYRRYSVTIRTADGDVVYRQKRLRTHKSGSGELLIFSMPARLLSPGDDYGVSANGVTSSGTVEPVSDYAFRVTAKK